MSNITIMQAQDSDIPVIEGILLDTVNWLNEMGQPLWEEKETKWSFLGARYAIDEFYIALIDGKPSGCMVLTEHRPFYWIDEDTTNSLFIHKLAVVKAAKHMGAGNNLMEYAKKYAAAHSISSIRLDCDECRPKLREFYENHGFICLGTKVMGKFHISFYAYTLHVTKTGWERENRVHFDEIVVNYDRARWDYPDELYADIISYLQTANKKAIEIGVGTGKATAPFLDAGFDVTAVELGANMAEFTREKYMNYSNFNVIVSDFEKVALPENNYDLIYAASAFHWVDAAIGCPKVFRLLKKGGTFALFRNNAVPEDGNELYEEIQKLYNRHYFSHYKSSPRPVRIADMTYEDFLAPAEIYRGFRFESMKQFGFENITMKLYKASQTYSADEYIALLDTYSDHRALPDDDRAALYMGVREAILRHGGQHKLHFIFQLYMGRKP